MSHPRISFRNISKIYGAMRVIDDLSLDIAAGEFVSLLGPSGSGKTTLLMMLAGFAAPTAGSILLDGQAIEGLAPQKRGMGVVFQNYALFPHMSVADNIAFPLRMRRLSSSEITQRVDRAVDMVQLSQMKDRRPSQLSGGQQQRVALARALVFEPEVVLMDEPLGALDKQLREQMQLDIRELHRRLELTVVFVTHDQGEALTMSDRIAIFNHGRIEQIGSPKEIYDRPSTRFVAEFIGETNLLEGVATQTEADMLRVRLPDGQEILVRTPGNLRDGEAVVVSVRPECLRLVSGSEGGANCWPTRIVDCVYHGDHLRVRLDGAAFGFIARSDRGASEWAAGNSVVATIDPNKCWVIRQ